ncbi:MAG: hypothetical protein JO356_14220, partial [Acidobacteria bacterium]|nr:hypothetical protein [Acidobacteriota bacterium]
MPTNTIQFKSPTGLKPLNGLAHWLGMAEGGSSGTWLRFLVAIAGLGVAFGLAIFSTAASQTGHTTATVLLASAALLVAAAVGVLTVP